MSAYGAVSVLYVIVCFSDWLFLIWKPAWQDEALYWADLAYALMSMVMATFAWHNDDRLLAIVIACCAAVAAWRWWNDENHRRRRRKALDKAWGRVVDAGGRLKVIHVGLDSA